MMEQQKQILIDEIMRKKREEVDMTIAIGNSIRWSLGRRLPVFGKLTSSSLLDDDDEDTISSDNLAAAVLTDTRSPENRFASVGDDNDLPTNAAGVVGYGRNECQANYFEEYSFDGIGWHDVEYPPPPSFVLHETKDDTDTTHTLPTVAAGNQTTIPDDENQAPILNLSWPYPLEDSGVGEDDTPDGIQTLMAIACWSNFQHSSRLRAHLGSALVENPTDSTIQLPSLKRSWTTTLA